MRSWPWVDAINCSFLLARMCCWQGLPVAAVTHPALNQNLLTLYWATKLHHLFWILFAALSITKSWSRIYRIFRNKLWLSFSHRATHNVVRGKKGGEATSLLKANSKCTMGVERTLWSCYCGPMDTVLTVWEVKLVAFSFFLYEKLCFVCLTWARGDGEGRFTFTLGCSFKAV